MNLDFLTEHPSVLLAMGAANYLLLRLLFRKSLRTLWDPLHVQMIALSFYLVFFALPFFIDVTPIFFQISVLLVIFLLVATLPGALVNSAQEGQRLAVSQTSEVRFAGTLLLFSGLTFIVNVLFGEMPLISGAGSNARYLMGQNSRLLTWITAGIEGLPILLLSFAVSKKAKIYTSVSIALSFVTAILSASKGSLLLPVQWFVTFAFIQHYRQRPLPPAFKKIFSWVTVAVAVGLPLYVVLVTQSSGAASGVGIILLRLAGGFDQLIIWSAIGNPYSQSKLTLSSIYFAPLLKALGHPPAYNSAIDYFFVEYVGLTDTSEGMFPNSNLVMEALLTNTFLAACVIVICAALISFGLRSYLLKRSELRIYHLFVYQFVVASPFMWLLDGQRFFVSLYTSMAVYLMYAAVSNATRLYFHKPLTWD